MINNNTLPWAIMGEVSLSHSPRTAMYSQRWTGEAYFDNPHITGTSELPILIPFSPLLIFWCSGVYLSTTTSTILCQMSYYVRKKKKGRNEWSGRYVNQTKNEMNSSQNLIYTSPWGVKIKKKEKAN